MVKEESRITKTAYWFSDFIKSRDQFGVPVGLTIKGESSYNTIYGGAISIGLTLYTLYLLINSLTACFNREITNSHSYVIKYDITEPFDPF